MRRAKIVATLGPATSSYDQIEALVRAGMDVARLNMSHGEWNIHERSYANVRRAADATDAGRRRSSRLGCDASAARALCVRDARLVAG